MQIRELDPRNRPDVEALNEYMHLVGPRDAPWIRPLPLEMRAAYLVNGWDGEPPRVFLGERDGELVAIGQIELPQRDNLHLAWTTVLVRQEHRRQGLGTQMLQHLMDEARRAGRTSIGIDGWESAASTAFAARHGFDRKSQSIQRRLHVRTLDRDLIAKLIAEARAAAEEYELVRVFGATPDDMLDEVVEITAAINDAPLDDLQVEDEVFSVERLRAYEQSHLASGRLYTLYARHVPSGKLAGKTVVQVQAERPEQGHQHDTSVIRAHRGHRLGLLLKAAMVEWLDEAEPQLEAIDTWNAESNDHMIGINEQLGYVILGRELEYQRDL